MRETNRPSVKSQESLDRIEGNKIIISGQGDFPKKLVIIQNDKRMIYSLVKSRNGKFLLN